MWWVVNQVSRPGGPRGPQQTNYVVVQSATRPPNAVAGPFSTQADAQAWQTSGNTAGNSPGSAAGGAVNAAKNALTNGLLPENFLMRTGEVLIGLILLAIGLSVMLKNTPVGDAAGTVAKHVPKVVPV